jgi:hypothetical protein
MRPPSTLNFQRSTLNAHRSTINHQQSTINHQPTRREGRFAQLSTPNAERSTLNENGFGWRNFALTRGVVKPSNRVLIRPSARKLYLLSTLNFQFST